MFHVIFIYDLLLNVELRFCCDDNQVHLNFIMNCFVTKRVFSVKELFAI